MASPSVSLVAEPIFHLGPITVTNSMMLGAVGVLVLFGAFFYAAITLRQHKYNRLNVLILWGFESLLTTTEEVLGDRAAARRIAPLAITMFFLIVINNWLEVLPILNTITWHGVSLFRGLAADLNFTTALAIITMVSAQLYGIKNRGIMGNTGRYIVNPFRDPLHAFEGFLEIIAEFSRGIALSMRLFGNIFGGEVLLIVISFITSWAAPIALPFFILLELFVGAIQAYVFYMLTVVFISLGALSADEGTPTPVLAP